MQKLGIVLLLSFMLSGCSVMNEIVIVNLSSQPILIEYEIDLKQEGIFIEKEGPYFCKLKMDDSDFEVVNTKPQTAVSKLTSEKISFLLQPMEMATVSNFRTKFIDDPKEKDYTRFNLKEIKITNNDSTVIYAQGDQSRHLFSPVKNYSRGIVFR